MRPTKQQILHDPEKGIYGDCFRAVIASLLELSIEEVPHFCIDGSKNEWYWRLNDWLKSRNLCFLEHDVSYDNGEAWRKCFVDCKIQVYHTISGTSPRFKDELHCVIGLNGVLAFDPHPDNSGVQQHQLYGFLIHTGGK